MCVRRARSFICDKCYEYNKLTINCSGSIDGMTRGGTLPCPVRGYVTFSTHSNAMWRGGAATFTRCISTCFCRTFFFPSKSCHVIFKIVELNLSLLSDHRLPFPLFLDLLKVHTSSTGSDVTHNDGLLLLIDFYLSTTSAVSVSTQSNIKSGSPD